MPQGNCAAKLDTGNKTKQYTSYRNTTQVLQQPIAKTWIRKLQLTHFAKQTQSSWEIHNPENIQIQQIKNYGKQHGTQQTSNKNKKR